MTDFQPKFKFKKRSKASLKKKQLRRTTNDDATTGGVKVEEIASSVVKVVADNDNITSSTTDTIIPNHTTSDDEEEEEPSALTTIFAVERRRKILGRNNRGVDLTNLGKNTVRKHHHNGTTLTKEESSEDPLMQNKDLEERLKVNFAGGKLAGSNDMGGDDEGGVLAKKHRMAMEEFIQSNLSGAQEGSGANGSGTNNGSAEGEGGQNKNNASEAEKEMYAELLTSDNKGGDGNNAPTGAEEGDVGAGGAMMGGTGIAEVALPIDERIKHLKETERAAMEYERARKGARFGSKGDDGGMILSDAGEGSGSNEAPTPSSIAERVPMNFASGPGKRKRQEDVNSIGVADPSSQTSTKSQSTPNAPMDHNNVQSSSALPPSSQTYSASSAGTSVQKSDVSTLGASYSHNFQLHTKEWVTRRRDERQVEIDATIAEQEAEEGPPESRARVGFEMSRKMARGEVVPKAAASGGGKQGSGKGPNGESLRNDWDKKKGGGDQGRSNDDRVWRTFMSKERNRR